MTYTQTKKVSKLGNRNFFRAPLIAIKVHKQNMNKNN